MKKYGILSYNIYCNFTNYGSALQTYALHKTINKIDPKNIESVVIDYCPDDLLDKDVLNPVKHMWDVSEESKRMVELTMPAIRINNEKFNEFYKKNYIITNGRYTKDNFEKSLEVEGLDGYVCGSDTIWNIRESHGFDDGFFGNYECMKNSHTISYASCIGDVDWTDKELNIFKKRMQNFKAISVRESVYIEDILSCVNVPVERVVDPTLLLKGEDFDCITSEKMYDEAYVLLYVRRYNKAMEEYADRLAKKLECKVVEISLRATNSNRHIMRYDAGVEEFLSLIKYANYVVTNSFHGAIFSLQMHTPFKVFSRELADVKIDELLDWLDLKDCKMITGQDVDTYEFNFDLYEEKVSKLRESSLKYLKESLII